MISFPGSSNDRPRSRMSFDGLPVQRRSEWHEASAWKACSPISQNRDQRQASAGLYRSDPRGTKKRRVVACATSFCTGRAEWLGKAGRVGMVGAPDLLRHENLWRNPAVHE